jgi:hypothetical protein
VWFALKKAGTKGGSQGEEGTSKDQRPESSTAVLAEDAE